eukprot:jgi/Hompol1/3805/HPOL_003358-RA
MFATGRFISNVELSNIFDVSGLMKALLDGTASKAVDPFSGVDHVALKLSEAQTMAKLPANITFENRSTFKPRVQPPPQSDLIVRGMFVYGSTLRQAK